MLHELLDKQGLPNRIAPAPRDTDGKAACGMALLIHPDDIDAVRTCIEENHAEYVNIVPLEISCRKERPILLNAEYMINEERAKSSLLILTHHIQKPLNHLIFSGFTGMDLRGIEPLSESLFIQASPITVILLKVPPSARRMTGLPLR